jgi:hypothetical protein
MGLVVVAMLSVAAPALAGPAPQCCSCIVGNVPAGIPLQTLYCSYVPPESVGEFESQCDSKGGVDVPCHPAVPGQSCVETLANDGTVCPPPAPAPTANAWGLSALALGLATFGALTVRRYAR